MRSGHSLAFQQFEEVLSEVQISRIESSDQEINDLIQSSSLSEGSEVSAPFRMTWAAESDWEPDERRLADEGFEAEIASYTYSDEYLNNFGIDSVPYARTQTSVDGESTVAYQRNQAMDPGFAGFDADQGSVLQVSLASNSNPTAAGTRKVVGGGNRFTILWTSRVQLGAVRRSAQRSVVSYASLSRTIQSIQAQGGNILSIANA